MLVRRLDRSLDRSSESAFTLVELLVVLVIFSVIGGIVATSVISAFRSSAATQVRIEARQELELAMQQMTRELRGAQALRVPPPDDDATFVGAVTVPAGSGADRFSYFILELAIGEPLRLSQCEGEDCRDDDPSQRLLVTELDNDLKEKDQAVFTFLDREGDPTDQRAGAAAIQIRLMRTLESARPVIVETQVAIRSARYQAS